jgi:hypothetical protein
MKTKVFFFLLTLLFVTITISAQESKNDSLKQNIKANIVSNDSLKKMSLKQVCGFLGINYDYNSRCEKIILPLCKVGIILFDKDSNPYVKNESISKDLKVNWYFYVGTSSQNEKLKRNLIANRKLIRNGTISIKDSKKWKVVK